MTYCGRFAPSPTGPLHQGSLVAALASYLDARQHQGRWLLRIEDLDPLRESISARDAILNSLEAHGLHWDGPVHYQSQRHQAYEQLLHQWQQQGRIYPCPCSRKELQAADGYHPRHCRQQPDWQSPAPRALRFALSDTEGQWQDRLLGALSYHLVAEQDDPVLKRKEGYYAYHLGVVCDDIDQGVNQIVRGQDLLESTPIHLALYQALAQPAPGYLHIPLLCNAQGQKLSKQTHAPALDDRQAGNNLWCALRSLHQSPPADLQPAPVTEILAWAQQHWRATALPGPVAAGGSLAVPS
ncbi:MAG: tRNA glutamyl-Q(34) synthetase GluQRS [Halomonadaceae bacterium]|nr:MAG: tRNA glutamyl-Q(34) synthetase GluQRS [Halomonadaceae bacterium]